MGASTPKLDLANLATQLSQIAATVRQQCDAPERAAGGPVEVMLPRSGERRCAPGEVDLVTVALAWLRAGSAREDAFGPGLFFDPAWNMLLDLYVQQARGSRVSITSLTIAAGVPPTTALRWISLLEGRGLLEREPDRFDKRRCFVRLTDDAVGRIELALRTATQSDQKLGLGRLERLN